MSMEERKTVIQLVGIAHLGLKPGSRRMAERIETLRLADDDDVALELCAESRSESGHESPPLAALIQWMVAQGWSEQTIDLLLIVTEQDPPHAGDTAPIAGLIERAIPALPSVDPEKYSRMPRIESRVLRIGELEIPSVASAVTRALANIEQASLVSGPGSVTLQAGIFLGCIGAAVRPEIIELNRQGSTWQNIVVQLQTEISFQRWLARTGRYGALSNIRSDDERAADMIDIFAAAVALDWRRAYKLASLLPQNQKLLRAFPRDDDDVCELRYWTAFAIRARLAARDRFAYLWLVRLAQNEFRTLSNEHPHAFEAIKRTAMECKRPDCGVKNHSTPTVKTLMQCAHLWSHPVPAEIEALRMKLAPVWKEANKVRHYGTAQNFEPLRDYLSGLDLDAPPDETLPRFFNLPALRAQGNAEPHEKHLMLVAVGESFWDDRPGSPFLDALDTLTAENTHTVLLASPRTKELKPEDLVIDGFFVTVEAFRSVDQCVKALREYFRGQPLTFGKVHVGVAPGAQAMNLALLIAGVELSYETGASLNVHQLREDRSVSHLSTPRTNVVSMEENPDVRELAPTDQLEAAMRESVRVVDLPQLVELTERAPKSWRKVLMPQTKWLLNAAFDKTRPTRERLGLAWKAAHSDPDRGLLWGCAILEEEKEWPPKTEHAGKHRAALFRLRDDRNDRIHNQTSAPLDPRKDLQKVGFDNDLLEKLDKIEKMIDRITRKSSCSRSTD